MPGKRRKARGRKRRPQEGHSPQEVLVKALGHPVRVKALTILSERVASPREISEKIEVPLGNVSYHVRVLDELGLVELVEEERVRGSIGHFYKAVRPKLLDSPAWQRLNPKVRSAASGYLIEALINDAAASLEAGVFDERKDRHLTRTSLELDETGWRKILDIQAKAHKAILKEQRAAAARLKGSPGIQTVVGILCFEAVSDADD